MAALQSYLDRDQRLRGIVAISYRQTKGLCLGGRERSGGGGAIEYLTLTPNGGEKKIKIATHSLKH